MRPDHRRQPVDRRRGRERPLREAQRLLRQGRHQDERLHAGDRDAAIPSGRRARRTTGRCRRWATRSAGPTARTGSRKPELQAEFKKKHNRDLAPPKTWTEFKQVAEFFQGREIDGKKVYGAYHLHRARLRRHHDGRDQRALPDGLQVRGPEEALRDGRLRQLAGRGQGRSSSTSRSTSAARRPG